ncbi:MAG: hypothetical protein KBI47_10920 [Armatimonadetes bacterium]|jgi:hypothetical protein|nr:hypothetical protein [Armatimonadota bacterium]MDI9583964.1 hypothetical protein [Acidobacteriota bacterium]
MGKNTFVPVVALCLAAALVIALLPVAAQAQPGGRGGGQRGGQGQRANMAAMMYLEFTWAAVNFGCEATDEQIANLKPVYQDVYKRRAAVRAEAMQSRNFQAIQQNIDETNKELGAALLKELTEEQIAGLTEWQEGLTKLGEMVMAQQGQQGPQNRGRMGAIMYLERTWSAINFGLELTAEQMATLRPIFADAFKTRADAVAAGNADLLSAVLDDTRAHVEAKLKETLTEEQMAKYTELTSFGRPGGRGPGGGPGGQGGPGGGPGGPPPPQ